MKKMAVISLICFTIDQLLKSIMNQKLYLNQSINIIPSFFSITYVKNEGAAWNIFSGYQFFLILISIFALLILYHYFIKGKQLNKIETLSYGLLLGGIFGNLIDRICRGYVIDFLDFTLFHYHFPVFNIADICIVTGMLLIVLLIWKGEKNADNNSPSKSKTN